MTSFDAVQKRLSLILTNQTNALQGQKRRGTGGRNISGLEGGKKKPKIDGDTSYTSDQWRELTEEQRKEV